MERLDQIYEKLKNRDSFILDFQTLTQYAVLVPLIKVNNEWNILFEIRSKQLRVQPGEICFPGGKIDPTDATAMDAAIRETEEELNLSKAMIDIIAPLDYVITPFGTVIYPFLGEIKSIDTICPNSDEVDEIFTVPLEFIKSNKPKCYKVDFKAEPSETFPINDIPGGKNYNWRARSINQYFYYYEDKVIWGLTAKILKHLSEII